MTGRTLCPDRPSCLPAANGNGKRAPAHGKAPTRLCRHKADINTHDRREPVTCRSCGFRTLDCDQCDRSPDLRALCRPSGRPVQRIGSTLDPGQTTRLPAIDTASVPIRTECPLETACHIKCPRKAAGRCHGRRRSTARSRPADKIQRSVRTSSEVGKSLPKLVGEGRVDGHVRKALPLDEQHPLANTSKVRKPHEVPFRHRPDIDQHGRGISGKRFPSFAHTDVSRIAWIFVE